MIKLKLLINLSIFALLCVSLASAYHLIQLSPSWLSGLWGGLMLLWGVSLVISWRTRADHIPAEPTPAQSVRNVILVTGGVAVLMLLRSAHALLDYVLPAVIAVITLAAAYVAFRFASKHAGEIGEARFVTTPRDG